MTRYVALLRGISPTNPNMRNEKLRSVFEDMGFTSVKTVISTGNVLFESPRTDIKELETGIEEAILYQLGFASTTIIQSQEQLQKLIDQNPFKDAGHTQKTYLIVTFLKDGLQTKLDLPFLFNDKSSKILSVHDGIICSIVDLSSAKTPQFMTWLEKQFGKRITTRTWNTVNKIVAKLG